jgi:hypothetical protein
MYKRRNDLPLLGGLRAIQAQMLSAGTLLYAMTVYDETHNKAFSRGGFGGGACPSDGGDDSDGGPKKGKKPKGMSQAANGKTCMSALGSKGTKRKAEQGAGEGSRGAKTKKRPSRIGTTASAIVAGGGPTTSASHAGEWDAAIQQTVTGPGSNFVRMQKLLARLQDSLPENQLAHGLPLGDFFRLQGKLANWPDPNPERRVNPASHALMGFCGTVLLPAALGISVEAVRFVIILLRALLDEVDPVLDRVEKRLEGKCRDDDKDDGTGGNKNVAQTATKQTGGQRRTGTGGGQEPRDKSRAKGSKGRQRPLVTHTAAQTATSPPPPARIVAPKTGPPAIIPNPKATVHSAGPTPTQHPLQGTWFSVTLTARGSCVVAVLVKAPVAHFKGSLTLPSRLIELDNSRFTGAPGVVRSDSAPATVPAVTQRPASLLTTAQQINLRAFLSGPTRESRPGKTGYSNLPQRTGPRIDKSVAARLARPHLPRAGEVPPLSLPLTAGPMPTRPLLPPPLRPATGGPEAPSPQELALSRAENRERLLVVEETAMRGQLLVRGEKRDALQAQLVEARCAVARERDILDAARWDIERTTGRPLLHPPPPERLHAGNTRAEREAIDKEQFDQHLATTRGFTDQLRAHAAERNNAGLLDERRRLTTENLAQRRSGSKFGGSKSGGSKSGSSGDRSKDTTPPPRRELTPPRRQHPRDRTRTLPRAPTPPRDLTRGDRRGDRRARTPSPPPRRRLRSDSRDRGPPRPPSQDRRPGKSGRGGRG